jgi:hypothetical protein
MISEREREYKERARALDPSSYIIARLSCHRSFGPVSSAVQYSTGACKLYYSNYTVQFPTSTCTLSPGQGTRDKKSVDYNVPADKTPRDTVIPQT